MFLLLSILLPLLSPIPYILSILRGEAKPHRTTRLVILATTVLTTLSLIIQHDNTAIWLSLVSTIQAIIIFTLSIKYGMGGWSRRDITCLAIAGIGILAWQTTHNPAMAVYFSVLADFIGMLPTIIKTYHYPHTELWYFFAIDTLAGICNLLAMKQYTIQAVIFPLYIVCINGAIAILALRNRNVKNSHLIQ
jgi:hypothetical protein